MTFTKKIHLSLIVLLITILLLIVFLIHPLFQDIKKNSKELLSQKEETILLAQKSESLKEIKNTLQNYQSNLQKIEGLFINPELPIEFVNFLEKNASQSSLLFKISSIVKNQEKEDVWPSFSIQVSTIGPFPNSLRFLEKLENSPYLIEILNLKTERLTEKKLNSTFSLGDVETNLLLKVYTK